MSLTNNAVSLTTSATNPIILKPESTSGVFTAPLYFPVGTRVITNRTDGSIIYNNKTPGSFFVSVSAAVEMAGNGFIRCRLRANGNAIPFSIGLTEIKSGVANSLSFSIIGEARQGDVFDAEFASVDSVGVVLVPPNGSDILVKDFVLNGYQF